MPDYERLLKKVDDAIDRHAGDAVALSDDLAKNPEISEQEFEKILDKLEQAKRSSLYCKVSAKGAVSVYGLQRMPVTLYAQQWDRLLEFGDELKKFIEANEDKLSFKEAKDAE